MTIEAFDWQHFFPDPLNPLSLEVQIQFVGSGDNFSINQNSNNLTFIPNFTSLVARQAREFNANPMSSGDDLLIGTDTNDNIFAWTGNDTVLGLDGNDILGGQEGSDFLLGHQGNDTLYAGKGDDTLAGGQNSDVLFGDIGNDLLFGDRGEDEVFGNQGNDTLYGGKDNDLVAGGDGNDHVFGDLGDDILFGDLGADTLVGGEGNDTFNIGQTFGGSNLIDADIIENFTIDQDSIQLLEDLTFSDLKIYQGSGDYTNDTIIQDQNTNEYLAILKNINSNTLSADDFIFNDVTPTPEPTPAPTVEPTPTPTPTPVPTVEPTPTPTPTPAPTVEPTPTPTPTPVPTVEPTPTPTPTPAPTVEPTPTPTPAPTVEPTPTPTPTPAPTPVPTVEPTPTPTPAPTVEPTPTPTPTPVPTVEPTPTPTPTPAPTVEPTPTPTPTPVPTVEPTPTPTPAPTVEPTPTPTPTPAPTPTPTPTPTPAPAGVLTFSAATFSVQEDGTPVAVVTVNRTEGSSGIVTASVTPSDGTATAADYTQTPVTVSFADGDIAAKTVTIPILNDTVFEPTETVNLALAITGGTATLGTQNTAVLQIFDNDQSENLDLTSATYLGTAGNDTAAAVEISPVDNNLVVAGNFNGLGEIQRYQNGLTAPLSTTALGGVVNDLDLDRDSGEVVAVGDFGIKVYDPTASTVLWSQPGSFNRVAIANDGTIATLNNSTDTVTLWNPTGTQLGTTTLTGTNVNPADIAIHPTTKQVFVTGYNQVASTLQTPFLRAFDSALNLSWNTWDFTASEVTGQNLGADTRGERVTFGKDNNLYFLGRTDGGNNVFQRNGEDITQPLATLVNVDSFTNFSGAGAGAFTFHAKINPTTGSVERGQFIVTRTSTGANSFTPNSITADEVGNVYIGGSSAFQLENRPLKTINNQAIGSYTLGEIAVLGLTPDYTVRKFWTPLTQTGDTDGSAGNINGFAVGNGRAAIFATITKPAVATTSGALNPNPLGGNDAYLATWAI